MFEFEVVYDEDVVSLNDDDNIVGVESEIVMFVIDGDKFDYDDDSSFDDELFLLCGGCLVLCVVK